MVVTHRTMHAESAGSSNCRSLLLACLWWLLPYIKVGDWNGDVVDHALFTSPSLNGFLHQKVDGTFRIPILVVAIDDDHHYFVVTEPVPNSIRSHHKNLVVRAQVGEVWNLGLCCNTDASCGHVTDWACHGEARHLLVLKPDALRPIEHTGLGAQARHGHTLLEAWLLNSAIWALDASCFIRLFRLVIAGERGRLPLTTDKRAEHGARISRVSAHQVVIR